jgi:predicted nucleotidyltransferase
MVTHRADDDPVVIDLPDDAGHDGPMTLADLDAADAFLRDFATRHGIRRLALFGSVLRGEETPASDIDLLVEFEEDRTPGLLTMAKMELELGAVLGREVERPPTRTSVGTSGTTSGHRRVCSMPLDDEVRVRHLVEAASTAVSYAAGRSRADLDDDELLRLAHEAR